MHITFSRFAPAAASAVIAAFVLAAPAHAADSQVFGNAKNTVRCSLTTEGGNTFALCTSDIGRGAQPECNPPNELVPSVAIEPEYVGTSCWNQGFDRVTRLQPLQIRSFGTATVIPGFTGSLYVLDLAQRALVRAGTANKVIFGAK
ncbi:hypothetical protein V6D40_08540 [Corynebacterium sp. Q4381]|uniref:hypothetical protein n=1 Tax=Corynebacterium sp. Marseille-Q4381 TaxID=3121597 RepID=UPI002FE61245